MVLAYDVTTGALLGQVVDIRPMAGMVRILCRGGGYRSVMAEYVRLESTS
jgi:hypothetical protein